MATQETDSANYRPAVPEPTLLLAQRLLKGTVEPKERVITDHVQLVQLIDRLRAMGCIIVFVTGVWDLFHIGHAEYLRQGKLAAHKQYPDADHIILVVGADSDALTKKRKGESRPVVPEQERCNILTHLREVDIITLQTEPNQLYKMIDHDVRIISTSTADLPSDHGKIRAQCQYLVNLPPQAETSTSARIRTLTLDGGIAAVQKVRALIPRISELIESELREVTDGLES